MSLYYVQKLLYQLNRDSHVRRRFEESRAELLSEYQLTDEERAAITDGDIGLLYVMGVNGQILMHYSALIGQQWDEYINSMKDGVKKHGPVRQGLYSLLKDRAR
ncbi:MAG TPA: aromatic ring-opening dioxygenase subunit LigA [Gammaproteobacteria bacterium]|nr:aromatic ring-opening dioxygenase subunit LigA [Gammaproteobacteria bacterium]